MLDPITLYHGCRGEVPQGFTFGGLDTHPQGIHLGTLEQARMRARGDILEVRLRLDRLSRPPARVRDQEGSWRKLLARRRNAGALVYLNRFEGLSLAQVLELCAVNVANLGQISDAAFRRLVPGACDSYVVLDPELVEILSIIPRATSRLAA